ncbi:MAG TPA: squalene--hopene cyclase, partial [Casimicrobiaceae bacterium]|nr:squalene--hopene cyclase [Casimicrobiaceae bacterium]
MQASQRVAVEEGPAQAQSVGGLELGIQRATAALLKAQRADGHWVFELEADVTIPAEHVALQHFLGDVDRKLERKLAIFLRRRQCADGGWSLVYGGPFNISASVKAYLALKLAGDSPDAPHMRNARGAILSHGGAGTVNVFTRILLALFGFVPWSVVPVVPVEIMLLPRWFPFHLSRVSYWTRTVLVPLLVLHALRPRARNPRGVRIDELFPGSKPRVRRWARASHQSRLGFPIFVAIDAVLHWLEPLVPPKMRKRAIDKAVDFVDERLNGEDGLGAIFPAMANVVMMFEALGVPRDNERVVTAREAIRKLLVVGADEAYCQPCVSPVWDTALACHALLEVGGVKANASAYEGLAWLCGRQVLDTRGDWEGERPNVRPGGWAFQYANPHYPDLDDTAAVVMAMDRMTRLRDTEDDLQLRTAIARASEWVVGMQSRNGGWGAFDADNCSEWLNHIPFADHGALLDPPSADVTARCVSMLFQLGGHGDQAALAAGLAFLRKAQEADGSWYGRWGMNYIYGTWSVLCALNAASETSRAPQVRRAIEWLAAMQNDDGGWGETAATYDLDHRGAKRGPTTASQTSWALLAMMAGGAHDHPAVLRGVQYLLRTQGADGFWSEPQFTATGFPRVFYLRYHGYA